MVALESSDGFECCGCGQTHWTPAAVPVWPLKNGRRGRYLLCDQCAKWRTNPVFRLALGMKLAELSR